MSDEVKRETKHKRAPKAPLVDDATSSHDENGRGEGGLPAFLSEPLSERFQSKKVEAFGKTFTFGEPSIAELAELSDTNFKMVPEMLPDGSVGNIEIVRNTPAYMRSVLMNHIDPPTDPDAIPGRDAAKIQWLIDEWERWSGASDFFQSAEQRLENLADNTPKS